MYAPVNIGIREIRQLISFVKDTHGVDYSEYALTSFKKRVEQVMSVNKYSFEMLLKKLESKPFLDQFIGQIAVSATELFRDPTFWILLKNTYLANIFKEQANKVRIWVPMCASGEEFYSLAILLKENEWSQRAEVYLSGVSDSNLDLIKKGWIDGSKLEVSTKNYGRFQGVNQLTDYYKTVGDDVFFDRSLFENTTISKQGLNFNCDVPLMHFILFRNQMIYFNPTLQYKLLDALYDKLSVRGLLALGILEEIELNNVSNKYSALNKEESIYQKR